MQQAWSALTVLLAVHVRYQPLGSPSGHLKRSYVHVPGVPETGVLVHRGDRRWGAGRVGTGDGYTGWAGEGYYPPVIPYLVLPGPNPCPRPRFCVHQALPGPSRPRPHTWLLALKIPPSRTNSARFSLKYPKVSNKSGVSSKIRHEACHTPYIKKGSGNHDLEFPGFSIWLAFSG